MKAKFLIHNYFRCQSKINVVSITGELLYSINLEANDRIETSLSLFDLSTWAYLLILGVITQDSSYTFLGVIYKYYTMKIWNRVSIERVKSIKY